jgi:hypothetical protein
MKNKKNIYHLSFLRILTNWWGILTFLLFIFTFLTKQTSNVTVSTSAVIYAVVLALFVGNKEFSRWQSKKGEYKSLYFGEFYLFLWSIAMVVFVIISVLSSGQYHIPSEFPATYITILGIYVLSQQSKVIYHRK